MTPVNAVAAVDALPTTFDYNGKEYPVPADVAPLFTPIKFGVFELTHRIAMAPLTRCRAIGTVPAAAAVEYYTQRAHRGGMLISEGTCVTQAGQGYPHTPGIYTPEQLAAWRPITKAVKEHGTTFVCQLWHVGRASHQEYQPNGAAPLGPSAIAISDSDPSWRVYTSKGAEVYPVPHAMTIPEIKEAIQQFRQAARNAIDVGFDGVEIHGANGYLLDEFIKTSSNKRTDEYGGPIENRARLVLEVVQAVVDEVGADRVGLRLSPFIHFLDVEDETPYATFSYILEKLQPLGLAYVHLIEPRTYGDGQITQTLEPFRRLYKGTMIMAGSYTGVSAAKAIADGHADLVAFGRSYLSNPDLPKRFLLHAPLNKYDRATFYSHGMEGYIDYPALADA